MRMFSTLRMWMTRPRRSGFRRRRLQCHSRLCLEPLEERTLLSVYTSTDVPKPILDYQTVTSAIDIGDSYAIGDLNVNLDITHTWDGDVKAYLIAPDGTRVELFTSVGSSGDNFTNTVLDDQAATAIGSGAAPFTGAFRPAGSLATLAFMDVQGTWKLEITDQAGQDQGTLNSWSLSISANTVTDDFPNTFAAATDIPLSSGAGSQAGTIDYAADVDMFRVTAAITGFMMVRQDKTALSTLDSYLQVYDSSQSLIQSDDNGGGAGNSLIYFPVTAGQTYYIRSSAAASTSGDYQLSITTTVDDFGNTFASASTLTLSPSGSANQGGTIEQAGDVDMFRFVAPVSGIMTIQQTGLPPGTLDSYLEVYDSSQSPIVSDDDGAGFPDSMVQFAVTAGQTFYVRAGASPFALSTADESGDYQLTISSAADDFGNTFAEAGTLTLSPGGSATQSASIELARDVDMFSVTAVVSGIMSIRQDAAAGSTLDSFLRIYDSSQAQIASNDNGGGGANSLVQFAVTVGQTYFVRASASALAAASDQNGAYQLTVTNIPDDFGNTFAEATTIVLSPSGSGTQLGSIEIGKDVDMFTVTVPIDGIMIIHQDKAGSSLDSYLEIYDSSHQQIAYNDDGGGNLNSLVELPVSAGEVLFIRARGFATSTGAYQLSIATSLDDFGNTFATAHTVALSPSGGATQAGTIEASVDVDMFDFVAPIDGIMIIRQDAATGSTLDGYLEVYDNNQSLITSDDNAGGGTSSRAAFNVTAGSHYYVRAGVGPSAFASSKSGSYQLTFSTVADDFGNTFATAHTIVLSAAGSAVQAGTIEADFDVDMFEFTAPVSGIMVLSQDAATGSTLEGMLDVYDASHNVIEADDGGRADFNEALFYVTAGAHYFVRAGVGPVSDPANATGSYRLNISTRVDDFGNTFAAAHTIDLSSSGSAIQPGVIEAHIDADMFRFVAPISGTMTIRQTAVGSTLDTDVTVFDSNQTLLATNDDIDLDAFNLNSEVQLRVVAGRTYYVQAGVSEFAAFGDDSGSYQVAISTVADDFGNTFADAEPIALNAAGSATKTGSIEISGDVDFFRFVATMSGYMSIRQDAANRTLDSVVEVFDANQMSLARDDNGGGARNSLAYVVVTAGQTYYVRAAGQSTTAGAYKLTLTSLNVADDFGNDFAHAHNLNLSPAGAATQRGVLEVPIDVDMFRFKATVSGWLTVTDVADNQVQAFDDAHILVDAGHGRALFEVVAGQTYFIQYNDGARDSIQGPYELSFKTTPAQPDDFGDTAAMAHRIPMVALSPVLQDGFIEVAGDTDFFRFVAPATGAITLDLSRGALSSLRGQVLVYDASQHLILTTDELTDASPATTVQFSVQLGKVYFLQVLPSSSSGRYQMQLFLAPTRDDFGNSFASAQPLTLSKTGTGSQVGVIEKEDDVDMFVFIAPISGQMTIATGSIGTQALDATIDVFDGGHNRLGGGTVITIDVVEGQTYYVRSSDAFGGTGTYFITVQSTIAASSLVSTDAVGAGSLATLTNLESFRVGGFGTDVQAFVPLAAASITVANLYLAPINSGSVGGSSGAVIPVSASPDYEASFSSLPGDLGINAATAEPRQPQFDATGVLVLLGSKSLTHDSGDGPRQWPIASLFPMGERTWALIATFLPASAAERGPKESNSPAQHGVPLENGLDDLFLQGQISRGDAGPTQPTSFRDVPRPGSHVWCAPYVAGAVEDEPLAASRSRHRPTTIAEMDMLWVEDETPASRPWMAALLTALAVGAWPALVSSLAGTRRDGRGESTRRTTRVGNG